MLNPFFRHQDIRFGVIAYAVRRQLSYTAVYNTGMSVLKSNNAGKGSILKFIASRY
jgi:hypothetical protein